MHKRCDQLESFRGLDLKALIYRACPPLPIHLLPTLCVKSSYRLPVCHNDYVDSIESAGPEPLPSLLTPTAVGSYRGKFNFRHACPVNDCALRHCRVLLRAPLYPQRKEKENQINGLSTSVEPLIVQGMTGNPPVFSIHQK